MQILWTERALVIAALSLSVPSVSCSNAHGAPVATADAGASESATPDAAPDVVDNGAPSTTYPAPHPPLPTLTNASKGPLLTTPSITLVFFPGDPNLAPLEAFVTKFVASTYWSGSTHEYGVGPLTYAGAITLTGQTPPASTTSAALESWVATEIQSGAFGTPNGQTIYTIIFPASTVITQPSAIGTTLQSCTGFAGYHDNTPVGATDGGVGAAQQYAFAVIPTCSTAVDDLTFALSHEWVESATDPFVTAGSLFSGGPQSAFYNVDADHQVWSVLAGGEAGDLCVPEGKDVLVTPPDIGNVVQRTWSNLSAQGSHDPCVPAISGAFFDSAPVLPETVTFTSSLVGNLTTQGVTIPVGQSKTLEVDLFSDGDTGGPWQVAADDVLHAFYGLGSSMKFSWDRAKGVNGEKLHLTITVTARSIIGNGHAFMITSTLGTRTSVWAGAVVED
jgi:hypothetical protein